MSDFDMSEITDIFFEESVEGLEVLEAGLLRLEPGEPDADTVNEVFRAAHSIKGGAGTFGFEAIAEFTHHMETLLDQMRSGERNVTEPVVALLLKSVDCLRDMLGAAKEGAAHDTGRVSDLQQKLEAEVAALGQEGGDGASGGGEAASVDGTPAAAGESSASAPANVAAQASASGDASATAGAASGAQSAADASDDAVDGRRDVTIKFAPHPNMMSTGNCVLSLTRDLAALGAVTPSVALDKLPAFGELNPEVCYLDWTFVVRTTASLQQLRDVFDWVELSADIAISEGAVVGEVEARGEQASGGAAKSAAQGPAMASANAAPSYASNPVSPAPASAGAAAAPTASAAAKADAAPAKASPPPAKAAAAAGGGAKGTADAPKKAGGGGGGGGESTSIRVSIDKIDNLLNLVGELVITQSMLRRYGADADDSLGGLKDSLAQLERHTRELQESVMQIRMLPIRFCFSRFPRLVRDLSAQLGKKIDLKLTGQQTELDKTVLEKIGDPLVHLVRNSLDHGIEPVEKRREAGKPETGTIELSAFHEGGNIVIRISDDGQGLDPEKILAKARSRGLVGADEQVSDERAIQLIFQPGFSTAETVSDVSGRGVGMDVVRRNIKDLGGRVEVHSEVGVGTVFTIRLPLTLAILDGQLVRIGEETFVLSLLSIVETVQVRSDEINEFAGKRRVYQTRGEFIPVTSFDDAFYRTRSDVPDQGLLVIVEADGQRVGLFVDELLEQQQVVIKSLEENYRQVEGLSGATILGDGTVALILDVPGFVHRFYNRGEARGGRAAA
ncbi:MAG: chemotaxis protein CheA [Pseudomonadota bacterium]